MTKALKDAFKEAEKLSERDQDQLAAAMRAEIEVERAWEARLAASGSALGALADEALAEHRWEHSNTAQGGGAWNLRQRAARRHAGPLPP